ncbi:NAD(P)-dependent alcohol dehydrogenase [Microbacterium sp. LjRoot45]|uniref:NAD(P)-dependent alcohol dehydrogenase n=1 Tax=Microbacterium sp. LjRoot45 TaxID=3342329 RepID=UPI003ECED0EE
MKAVVYDRYTPASGLRLEEVAEPEPGPDTVLVDVAAASLNPFDWHMYRGEPWVLRASEGWRVREARIVGADIAGTVRSAPADSGWAPGDRVLGSIGSGGLAEVARTKPHRLARIDDETSFPAASAVPMAALTALQALRDTGSLTDGERVLVWGASGGVGHLAVQIARTLGARRVDAVASARHVDFLRHLGADAIFDRTAELPASAGPYDVVVDTAATVPVRRLSRHLAPHGRLVTVGSVSRGRLLGPATSLLSRTVAGALHRVTARGVFATVRAHDLAAIAGWLGDGTVRPEIARTFALADYAEALAMLESGHVRGKVVIDLTC